MKKAALVLDKDYAIARIDERLYGSFIEHLGRAVYGGIYEPDHPTADCSGFRRDVMDMVRQLNVSVVRYPGGNFVSGFNWEDSVGPRERRPKRLDLAWFTTETNEVGLHEFVKWCAAVNTQPMYAVNLGTRGPDDARRIVEYCNHPGGTALSDWRIQNGARDPFGIKLWCLGNEMDGPWQICAKTATEYGRTAREAAKVMKWVDPTIEVIACGSSMYDIPTFGTWEYQMLTECYDEVDYVSLHRYYNNHADNTPDFLARSLDLDDFIHSVVSICDAVGGTKHSRKRLNLSFDEWNVWYHSNAQDEEIKKRDRWGRALPLLEDVYNFEDALLIGSLLITFLRNADRVKIACLAQLVNVIAPIMTRTGGGVWPQTIYWPLYYVSRYGRGTALRPVVQSPTYACTDYDHVPYVDATAVLADNGDLVIFAVNRSLDESLELTADLRGFGKLAFEEHIVLHHEDVKAVNTELNPDNVRPQKGADVSVSEGRMSVALRRQSFHVIRFSCPKE